MKKLLLLTAVFTAHFSFTQVIFNVGDVVPDFTVTDTKGVTHNLYDITSNGQYVYVDFFFTTCPPCQASQQYYNEFYDKYGCNSGDIFTISISGDSYDTDARIDTYEMTYGGNYNHSPAVGPTGGGASVVSAYGVSAFPTYCLIGIDNKLISKDIYPVPNASVFLNAITGTFTPTEKACSFVGVTELTADNVHVYPTISQGTFNLSFPDNETVSVEVTDVTGKRVYHNAFTQTSTATIELNVNPNVYLLSISSADKTTIVKRIVVQ